MNNRVCIYNWHTLFEQLHDTCTKGQSEYVNGRTGYTMDKKKKDKKTKNNLKTHYIES